MSRRNRNLDQPVVSFTKGTLARELANAHAAGAAAALQPVIDLIRSARKITTGDRAIIYVGDLEHAIGLRDQPVSGKAGQNDAGGIR